MNRILRRIFLLLAAGTVITAAVPLVPLMQSVKIGHAAEESRTACTLPEHPAQPEPDTQSETSQPERLAPAAEPVPDLIIERESDGSKALHGSRPYSCPDTDTGGEILDRHYGEMNGDMFFSLDRGGQVRNSTFWDNDDLLTESRIRPDLPMKTDGTPVVLIYHTHTTESFVSEKTGAYDAAFNFRTTEPDKNMTAVGNAIAEQLSAAGIGVVHAKEIHDFPVWTGSYGNSAETIREVLSEYPDICIALDIHRDAMSDGSTVFAPVCTENGRPAAQIMIISGCDDGTMNMPDYRENFHLASYLQQTAEEMYPGLTRPILFDYRKYNQDLTHGSLLIEVGSQGNTIDEAVYTGELVGKVLAKAILQLAD